VVDEGKAWGRPYHKPTERHNQRGFSDTGDRDRCPLSVVLCNFDIAMRRQKVTARSN
jgi:hypothetical protein